jgi:Family of unknown function (DUF5681)
MSRCGDEDDADKTGTGGQPPTDGREAPYEVGNRKPPKQFRFKPGRSGNPKGRPKGSTSFEAKIQKELSKLVTVHKNGKSVKMSKLDVGVTRLVDRFMTGDLKSTAIIIGLGKNDKSKTGEEVPDAVAMPDEANLEFIVERLKGLIKGGSVGPSDE